MKYYYWSCVFLALIIFFPLTIDARKDLVQRRSDRLEKANQLSDSDTVIINIHKIVPVYDVLGFMAANYDDINKFESLLEALRPVADKVKQLSGGTLGKRVFPKSVADELEEDRQIIFSTVKEIYGDAVMAHLKDYLSQKYVEEDTAFLGIF